MSLPETYKRAVFKEAGGALVFEDAPLQLPDKNEVLVRVEACGVCHSDTIAQRNILGSGFPIVPGHEVIGRVVAVGDRVEDWRVGDRVGTGWHGGQDGTCGACKKGLFQMCDNEAINSITRAGGYAEYMLVRSEAAVRVPEDVEAAEYAPLLCAGVTVFNSMRHMGIRPGETVAIQGLGGLGHLGIQFAHRSGYRVVAVSRGTDKESFARRLGAHEYVDASKGDPGQALKALGGAALIVATSPSAEQLPGLLTGLAPLGKLLVLAAPGVVAFDTGLMLTKGLTVQGWPHGHARDLEDTIRFAELQKVDCLIEKFPFDKANEAFDAMISGRVRFRAVITMD